MDHERLIRDGALESPVDRSLCSQSGLPSVDSPSQVIFDSKTLPTRMRAGTSLPLPLHVVTPLVPSVTLAKQLGVKAVYFKLDALQPSGSFKIRGIGQTIAKYYQAHPNLKIIVSSSGGNAGMAATVAGVAYNLQVRVYVPNSTPVMMIERLQAAGADVIVHGSVWDEAHAEAMRFVACQEAGSALLVHPFEGDDLVDGHSTLVAEIAVQLPPGIVPDVVVCAVGGGGLLSGILKGLKSIYHGKCRLPVVVGAETEGARSFALAVAMGYPLRLPGGITSIAKSLGALQVSDRVMELRDTYGAPSVRSLVVTDAQAVCGLVNFADEFRILVEPSCGAGLAACYSPETLKSVVPELNSESVVVVVVCGGSMVTTALIAEWRETFDV
ncbi:uncharacterized protein SPPG_00159 [Spizellomyces punctatus DAOM BR117]|uniref:L-serine ammonia-lyase n=1 Tax=Spizellomyces punctatus (strain DAOM BR117) TaxID=645134 RepID=A0A0L0HU46_SPIPD|nr:uncharacterized protein SPPG_00159 [Spizellomyces punctatus DAOM BR117]KND04430.1 hypothetical protein SPPG_00159 [Spizellomyces punctatus DAOM BR117]|eukprot:XP_016612469.1 hypothetical protein SPPG_00159 [Spizellomyces punctatus DAOM BR117]